jgi:hypothetical protein
LLHFRARLLSGVLSLGIAILSCDSSWAGESTRSIVDVRIDAPYKQIASSFGDEWAPTWGRDDVLYTANDDGSSFGGISNSAIAFGKLEGSDPYRLTATSLNSMRQFREIPSSGPEGAAWQALDTYRIGDSLYRFMSCNALPAQRAQWCLMTSRDEGKTWARTPGRPNQVVSQDMDYGPPTFVVLSKITATALNDVGQEYAYVAAHLGLIGGEDGFVIARTSKLQLRSGNAIDWSESQVDGTWSEKNSRPYIFVNNTFYGPDGGNWKAMNSYSVDGVLYMFVTRCIYPSASGDPKKRHIFQNSSIIESMDGGKTWTRDGEKNYEAPMFPGTRFGAPYFVWYGKDAVGRADNADEYVYAVSNNGYFENGDDYILGRVLRSKLPELAATDWSFYAAGNGMLSGSWTSELANAKPILTNPGKSGMTGMTYLDALHRYVMVSWHYHVDNFDEGIRQRDLGTVLEFFEASKPWGPWSKVKTFDTGGFGWYTPIIGQRFQTLVDGHTMKAFLYATGFYTKPQGGLDFALYKLNYMPVTLSTKPLSRQGIGFGRGCVPPAGWPVDSASLRADVSRQVNIALRIAPDQARHYGGGRSARACE